MSLDRLLSLPQLFVPRYLLHESINVCLNGSLAQQAYGVMLVGMKMVGKSTSPWHTIFTHGLFDVSSHLEYNHPHFKTNYHPQSRVIIIKWIFPMMFTLSDYCRTLESAKYLTSCPVRDICIHISTLTAVYIGNLSTRQNPLHDLSISVHCRIDANHVDQHWDMESSDNVGHSSSNQIDLAPQ